MEQVQGGEGRGRRKWILIPLILFMLITPLSPAKDFHNNGLVLSPLRESAGVIGERQCRHVELTKIFFFCTPKSGIMPAALIQAPIFPHISFLNYGESICERRDAKFYFWKIKFVEYKKKIFVI